MSENAPLQSQSEHASPSMHASETATAVGTSMTPPPFSLAATQLQASSTLQLERDPDDPLSVDAGQVTFDAEGNDTAGSRYFSRVLHWPGGASGVTLGRGYDFKEKTEATVRRDLATAGFANDKINILVGAIRLEGARARDWAASNKDRVGTITHEQQRLLFDIVYGRLAADVERISSKDDVVELYGATDFENLHPAIKDIVVDLRYRGDYKPSTRRWIQSTIASNDLAAMTRIMADARWMNDFGVPRDRFQRRRDFMQDALAGNNPAPLDRDEREEESAGPDSPTEETSAPIASGTVKADRGLSVRNGNGQQNTRLRIIPNGSQVEIYETKDGWHRIGAGEWVHAGYVTLAGDTPTSGEGPTTDTPTTDGPDTAGPDTAGPDTGSFTGDTWDRHTNSRISQVHPAIQRNARILVNRAEAELGIRLRVTQGLRTFAEQDALYAQGRTTPGNRVTNARGGRSYHNYGLAIDVVEITAAGAANWNMDWEAVGALGESIGWEWGGRWTSIVDKPHFQMSFGLSTTQLRRLYDANGGNFVDVGAQDVDNEVDNTPDTAAGDGNETALFEARVNTPKLNIRSGPGTNFSKAGSLSEGDSVSIYEENGVWKRIGPGKWVHGNYIAQGSGTASAPASDPAAPVTSPRPETRPETQPESRPETPRLDVRPIVRNVHDAMFGGFFGVGTDEEKIYDNLRLLRNDEELIGQFMSAYQRTYGRSVTADLRKELSDSMIFGNELSQALDLLNANGGGGGRSTGGDGRTSSREAASGSGGASGVREESTGGRTTTTAPTRSGNEMVDNSSWRVVDGNALVRNADGSILEENGARKTIPVGTEVSIVADAKPQGTLIVQVNDRTTGQALGWTSYGNLSASFMNLEDYISQAPNADSSYRSRYASWTACRHVSSEMVGQYLARTNPELKEELGITGDGKNSISAGNGSHLRILEEDKSFRSQTREERNYKIEEALVPHAQANEAIAYIDSYLGRQVPVVVGVDHTYNRDLGTKKSSRTGNGYNEGTTDHFITLSGMGVDPVTGKKFYSFFDPGRTARSQGTQGQNRLIQQTATKYVAEGVGSSNGQTYHLTMVVLFPADRARFSAQVEENRETF